MLFTNAYIDCALCWELLSQFQFISFASPHSRLNRAVLLVNSLASHVLNQGGGWNMPQYLLPTMLFIIIFNYAGGYSCLP